MEIQKLTNEKITKKIREYLTCFEHLPYGIAIAKNDSLHTIVQANTAFYKIIGHSKEEFTQNHANKLSSILVDHFATSVHQMIEDKIFDFELNLRIIKADGNIAWLHNYYHYDHELDIFFTTCNDITDKMITTTRNLSYEAFQTRNEILYYMGKYSSEHVIAVDAETDEIIYMNVSAVNLLGFQYESDWIGKTYIDIGFGGSIENVHPQYNEPLTEEFTHREYYNKFHKKYFHAKNKLLTIPSLNKNIRLIIVTDITPQTQLQSKLDLQNTLHTCVETLFQARTTNASNDDTYYDILHKLKGYYNADRAFFYKFKYNTCEIENIFEVSSDGLLKTEHRFPLIANDIQMQLINEVSKAGLISIDDVLDSIGTEYKTNIKKQYEKYQLETFSCVAINNNEGNIIAFMGVINPRTNEDSKEIMEMLSRFIYMYLESTQSLILKEEASKLESLSETHLVEQCSKNFKNLTDTDKNITDSLDNLCQHYDADFAIILSTNADDSCNGVSHVAGQSIPDLSPLQNEASQILQRWKTTFEKHPKFVSNSDFSELNNQRVKQILNEKYGIYNFIASPIHGKHGEITGILFVNNFKLLNRSRLLVHIVAKSISDYMDKIRIYQKAQLEPLTNLTNKIVTQKLISNHLENNSKGTLFIIDIDNFKQLNDSLGHRYGDNALIDISLKLKKIFRNTDVIGRVGGDEFMVFSPGLISSELIERKAKSILKKCSLEYGNDGFFVEITTSIGICKTDESCNSFKDLYEKADYALYVSKKNGKNTHTVYNDIEVTSVTSVTYEQQAYYTVFKELKSAIREHNFVVHYQPIYHTPTGKFTHAEALVRIRKRDGTLIYPDTFIQVANNTNLIVEMTYQVLEQICSDFSILLKQQPNTPLTAISINVPYLQFLDPQMEDKFMATLEKYGINPSQIKIEITERILISDLDFMLSKMESMIAKGFAFELDDFGTDYSNLQMCITLPVEIIKLDRSVLLATLASHEGYEFFNHIMKGIHSTGRQIILEGVETATQLEWATKSNCEYIQGYYFSKPVDFENFVNLLKN